jgi:hypothetical protein
MVHFRGSIYILVHAMTPTTIITIFIHLLCHFQSSVQPFWTLRPLLKARDKRGVAFKAPNLFSRFTAFTSLKAGWYFGWCSRCRVTGWIIGPWLDPSTMRTGNRPNIRQIWYGTHSIICTRKSRHVSTAMSLNAGQLGVETWARRVFEISRCLDCC